jgi:hypothetical protein
VQSARIPFHPGHDDEERGAAVVRSGVGPTVSEVQSVTDISKYEFTEMFNVGAFKMIAILWLRR